MSFTITVGQQAPDFHLPGIDGRSYSQEYFKGSRALVILFTCNHCPYVVGSEDRMIAFYNDYNDKGVAMLAVHSNDFETYPEDSWDNIIARTKEKNLPWPAAQDATQDVAKAFGAIKTPHYFLLDADCRVVYTGRMDDNPRNPGEETTHELRDAVDALLAGETVPPSTEAIGCTVKWKGKDHHFVPTDMCDFDPPVGG
jgi:peroxiredoxin